MTQMVKYSLTTKCPHCGEVHKGSTILPEGYTLVNTATTCPNTGEFYTAKIRNEGVIP